MHSSSRLCKWILERSSVDQPLEVGNELGVYNVFLYRVHVALLGGSVGAAIDGGNLFVENIFKAAACIGSKGGNLGDAPEDDSWMRPQNLGPKCCKELVEDGRRVIAVLVKWCFAQFVVPGSIVGTQFPFASLYHSCSSNNGQHPSQPCLLCQT